MLFRPASHLGLVSLRSWIVRSLAEACRIQSRIRAIICRSPRSYDSAVAACEQRRVHLMALFRSRTSFSDQTRAVEALKRVWPGKCARLWRTANRPMSMQASFACGVASRAEYQACFRLRDH